MVKNKKKHNLLSRLTKISPIPSGYIASLEIGRFFAILFVVLGYIGPFYLSKDFPEKPVLNFLMHGFYHLRQFGLPFFLFASGFLFGNILKKGEPLIPRYLKAVKRLSWLYFAWFMFYVLEPVGRHQLRWNIAQFGIVEAYQKLFQHLSADPVLLMLHGTKYHLWYLPALIFAVSILVLFLYYKKGRYLLPAAVLMFGFSQCFFQAPLRASIEPFSYLGIIRIYARSFAMVTFGWWFSQQKGYSLKTAMWICLVAIGSKLMEGAIAVQFFHHDPHSSMSFIILPAVFVIFILICHFPDFGKGTVLEQLGKYTLGIYILHPFVLSLLKLLNKKFLYLNSTVRDLVYPAVIFVFCIIVTKILSTHKLSRNLVR